MNYQIKHTTSFAALLHKINSTLAISVYHAGKILLLNTDDAGKLNLTPISYRKPMGIKYANDKLAIATVDELHLYKNVPELASELSTDERRYRHLFFPRTTYHTGSIDLHDVAFVNGKITGVNTLFSCICQFDEDYNFHPIWQPHFIDEICPEDRCHLNGMELENGELKYITALGSGNKGKSWKENIISGGILMDIPANKILLDDLSMPHSPRLFENKLYLLESAKGTLVRIDPITFQKDVVVKLKGMVRGLSIIDGLAFVGISKARATSTTMKKLDDSVKAESASIEVIDLKSGVILGNMVFGEGIEEIYDVQLLSGIKDIGIFGTYDKRHKQGISIPNNYFWRKPSKNVE